MRVREDNLIPRVSTDRPYGQASRLSSGPLEGPCPTRRPRSRNPSNTTGSSFSGLRQHRTRTRQGGSRAPPLRLPVPPRVRDSCFPGTSDLRQVGLSSPRPDTVRSRSPAGGPSPLLPHDPSRGHRRLSWRVPISSSSLWSPSPGPSAPPSAPPFPCRRPPSHVPSPTRPRSSRGTQVETRFTGGAGAPPAHSTLGPAPLAAGLGGGPLRRRWTSWKGTRGPESLLHDSLPAVGAAVDQGDRRA